MGIRTMRPFIFEIDDQTASVDLDLLSEHEKAVLSIIFYEAPKLKNRRITQRQIANTERWMGIHKKYEDHLKISKIDSTLRKVRQIIRNLRINHKAPILSDINGYWIPKSRLEVTDNLSRIENVAKAQAKAFYETYTELRKCFGVEKNRYFEEQSRLFAEEGDTNPPPPQRKSKTIFRNIER